jgi:hypothetical protein
MVHVHGASAQQLSARTRGVPLEELVARGVKTDRVDLAAMICCWPAAATRCTHRSTHWSSWPRGSRTAAAV